MLSGNAARGSVKAHAWKSWQQRQVSVRGASCRACCQTTALQAVAFALLHFAKLCKHKGAQAAQAMGSVQVRLCSDVARRPADAVVLHRLEARGRGRPDGRPERCCGVLRHSERGRQLCVRQLQHRLRARAWKRQLRTDVRRVLGAGRARAQADMGLGPCMAVTSAPAW
jgi:hypothetical protein